MRITNVNAFPVEIPLISFEDGGMGPYRTSHGVVEVARSLIIEVETDEGISGWGEINLILSPQTMKLLIEKDLGKEIIGENPFNIRLILHKLSFDISGQYFTAPAFASGIETACWDIMGKALERPIFELLGGRVRTSVPVSYCLGILDPDKSTQRAQKIMEEGFGTIKTKAGKDVRYDIQRVRAMREGGGPELGIRVDPNQAYTTAQAIEFLKKTEKLDLEYIEQPIRVNSFSDLASLRNRTTTPVGINEDCYLEFNLLEAIKKASIDVAIVDLEPLGGVLKLVECGGVARMANLPLAHHCGFDLGVKTAAILHSTSCIENFTYAMDSTYYSHQDDVLTEPFQVRNGCLEVPQGPGLGIRVDESKLEKYQID